MLGKITALLWLAYIGYWVFRSRGNKRTTRRQRTLVSGMVPRAALFFIFIALWVFPLFAAPLFSPKLPVQIVGLSVCLLGLSLAIWSRQVLGSNWSAEIEVKEQHELVTAGPYGLIRHPIYSGGILALAGTLLVSGQLRVLILLVIVTVGMVLRAKTEEQLMQKEFAEGYAAYKRRTKMLVPGVI